MLTRHCACTRTQQICFAHAQNCNDPDDAFEACWHVAGSSAWAARYNTWLLIKLTLKGMVSSFLFRQQ